MMIPSASASASACIYACTVLAILATSATTCCVDGFSSEGWRSGSSYGRWRSTISPNTITIQPLFMADENENENETLAAAQLQNENLKTSSASDDKEYSDTVIGEETASEPVAIDTTEDVLDDTNAAAQEEEEETNEKGEYFDSGNSEAIAMAVPMAVDDIEEVVEEEEDTTEDETATVTPTIDAYAGSSSTATSAEEKKFYFASAPTTTDSNSIQQFATATAAASAKQLDDSQISRTDDDARGLNLEIVANVAGDIARDLLSVLRFGAANLLTTSLPEGQREVLLRRMGASATITTTSSAIAIADENIVDQKEEKEEERASIQEEISIARAEEAQKNKKKWEKEKGEILVQMETAANARVENELKIQKMKLEEETAQVLQEKDNAMEAEKERLAQQAMSEERERAEALAASTVEEKTKDEDVDVDESVSVDNLFAVGTDEEVERNKVLEILLEKRRNQQVALESIETELRASVANEEDQRNRVQAMLEKRQNQQAELDTVEGNLRTRVEEIEAEKARYQQLVADLEAVKENEQELQQNVKQQGGDSKDDGTDEEVEASSTTSKIDDAGGDDSEDGIAEHPVLGPVIADLGYKRIHFLSSGRLGTIPVWNRNRTYRNNRAKAMAAEKTKSMELGFPGAICLYEAPSGKLSIVDGQHRVGMMAALKETINKQTEKGDDGTLGGVPLKNVGVVFEKILVEVYTEPKSEIGIESGGESESESESDMFAEQLFLEINKAEPVKLIDMPGVASAADRQVITEAVETLQEKYSSMFSPSQRCRVPNVNVDNLRSVIFGANILKRHKLTTSKKLVDWLLEQNAALGDDYEKENEFKQKLISKKQWTKATSNNFYLGLESSWLYK